MESTCRSARIALLGALLASAPIAAQRPALAQVPPAAAPATAASERREPPLQLPPDAVSTHSSRAGVRSLTYTATAGSLPLLGSKGETTAHVFFTAFTSEEEKPRPVTFVFNGG